MTFFDKLKKFHDDRDRKLLELAVSINPDDEAEIDRTAKQVINELYAFITAEAPADFEKRYGEPCTASETFDNLPPYQEAVDGMKDRIREVLAFLKDHPEEWQAMQALKNGTVDSSI